MHTLFLFRNLPPKLTPLLSSLVILNFKYNSFLEQYLKKKLILFYNPIETEFFLRKIIWKDK